MTEGSFTCRSARSGALTWGVSLAVLVETGVVHLWMASRFPVATWALTLLGVGTVAWLVADHRALGGPALIVGKADAELRVGRRVRGRVRPAQVASVTRPGWRDVPAPGTPGFLNATKPAEPNVLIAFAGEVPLAVLGATRNCRLLGLHLDEPDAAMTALADLAAPQAAGAAGSSPRTPEPV